MRSWGDVTEVTIQNCFKKAWENYFILSESGQEYHNIENENINLEIEDHDEDFPICENEGVDNTNLDQSNFPEQEQFETKSEESDEEVIIGHRECIAHLDRLEKYLLSTNSKALEYIYKIQDTLIEEKSKKHGQTKISDYLIKR